MKKKKKKLYCAFIDFAKAFDTVWRNGLWNKLLINQINTNILIKISSSFSISSVIQFSPKEFLLCKKCSKAFKYKENKKGNNFPFV
jgi:hypothetical protein